MSRFAAITGDILARKGEAAPWGETKDKPTLQWQPTVVVDSIERDKRRPTRRKISLRISQHDYERLGILAVKEGKTRQRLLQEAVERLFTGMTEQFGSSCRCLGGQSATILATINPTSRELNR